MTADLGGRQHLDARTPSPGHLLRVGCIADVTASWPPGSVFEIGAGTGDVTARFIDRGFTVTAFDLGEASRLLLRDRFGDRITVVDDPDRLADRCFDYVFAFEVLEHIVEDRAALASWIERLQPGGRVLFSVPAHQHKFGDADRAAGHLRRYERPELAALLRGAGLVDIELHNYGFPMGNALRWTRTGVRALTGSRSRGAESEQDRVARTIDSGVRTAAPLDRLRRLSNPSVLQPFTVLQRLTYQRDWSDGYVATAVRPTS